MARRRAVVLAAAGAPWLGGCAGAELPTFSSLAAARSAVQALDARWRGSGRFTPAQMLEHLAQSIEYSMQGYPQPRSALFQATLGRAAFAVFDARGAMTHALDDPIPGAPALNLALAPAAERCLAALQAFEQWSGPLKPHFAYGALDKAQYLRAHLMHIANHWTELVRT